MSDYVRSTGGCFVCFCRLCAAPLCPVRSLRPRSVCGRTWWSRSRCTDARPTTTPASRGRTSPAPGTAASPHPRTSSWTARSLSRLLHSLVKNVKIPLKLKITSPGKVVFDKSDELLVWKQPRASAKSRGSVVLLRHSVCKNKSNSIMRHRLVKWWCHFLLRLASGGSFKSPGRRSKKLWSSSALGPPISPSSSFTIFITSFSILFQSQSPSCL